MIRLLHPGDFISILNAFFGFLAIIILSLSTLDKTFSYRLSFSFILIALIADGFDGIIARKTKKGKMGPYLESMADFTSTGIATIFFVFNMYYNLIIGYLDVILTAFIASISFYVICCLIRLAAFHPLKTTNYFKGLPSPASAIVLLTCSYLKIPILYCVIIMIFISILMISSIHFPKPSFKLNLYTGGLLILIIIFDKSFFNLLIWILLISILMYISIGPLYSKMFK
jgi:CDP-diacylglycerol--serine O-phosphatidyltransferase